MSATPTPVSGELLAYIADHTHAEDPFLAELKQSADAEGIPPIWIGPAQASFMQILLKAAGARSVLEVGTLAGYSAIAIARALGADGTVDTIELSDKHADFAEAWVAKSDVAGRVRVLRGAGAEVLATLEGPYDAAFLDADKSGYPVYLDHCLRLVRPGGLILVDNAFAFGQLLDDAPTDPEVPAVRAFNAKMAETKGLHGIIAPVGDGLWVAVRESEGGA